MGKRGPQRTSTDVLDRRGSWRASARQRESQSVKRSRRKNQARERARAAVTIPDLTVSDMTKLADKKLDDLKHNSVILNFDGFLKERGLRQD